MEAIELADRCGFDAVEARCEFLSSCDTATLDAIATDLLARELSFGTANLPVNFHDDEATFQADLKCLPRIARNLRRAGVTLFSTWLAPCHGAWPFDFHFELHVRRLNLIADVIEREGFKLGLEYLAPQTLRAGWPYSFIYSLAQTVELLNAVGRKCLGILLDSFHWYTANETVKDLLALPFGSVLGVDLNDAPLGTQVNAQRDNERELPCATGVIDLRGFLQAIAMRLSSAVPVRVEPFNAHLNSLPCEQALSLAMKSLHCAFSLLEQTVDAAHSEYKRITSRVN
ncbi:MAG TPA: TIM barrel protein [Candidatus Angelobacter sp.]|jgi:sugar phosphate isomerase/epimerase|nr:TIM barrel protein [Candidatus Angelobacter sp.]